MQMFIEAKVLEALRHPFIVSIRDSYKTRSEKLVLILEYAEKGDLKEMISRQKGVNFPESLIKS